MSPKTNKEGKQCTICSRLFHKNSLRRHIQSVHKVKTFSIPNNYDEESEPTLEIHSPVRQERKGQTMPGFQFVSCDASFIEDSNSNSHVAEDNMIKSLSTKTIELNPNINQNPEIKTEDSNLNIHTSEVCKRKFLDAKTLELNASIISNPEIKKEESNLNTNIAEDLERNNLDAKALELNGRIKPDSEIISKIETNICKICNIEFYCSTDFTLKYLINEYTRLTI